MPTAYVMIRDQPHYRSEAFVSGCEARGFSVVHRSQPPALGSLGPEDLLVTWNLYGRFLNAKLVADSGGAAVIVTENGYFGQDAQGIQYYAMGLGGHNGSGLWPTGGPERWLRHGITLAPWRPTGGEGQHILVADQRGIGHPSMRSPSDFGETRMARLREITRRELVYRPHPGRREPERTLDQDLSNCWAVVTWGSNVANQALFRGIPVFYESPHISCKAAAQRGLEKIETPDYPDREACFRASSWGQWSIKEIASGEPIRLLLGLHARVRAGELKCPDLP